VRRANRNFRYHPEASEDFLIFSFLILPSSFFRSCFVSDSAANDDTRDAIIARLAKAASIARTR
jgi:hypothetical protein